MKKAIIILLLLASCEKEPQDAAPTTGSISITILPTSPQPSGNITSADQNIKIHSSDWNGRNLTREVAPGSYTIFLTHPQVGNETISAVVIAGEKTEVKPSKF